jgi:uncharacterized protein (AIM24 family)
MERYSVGEFVQKTAERKLGEGLFEQESDRLLEVNLDGKVWTKTGSMVAYTGDVAFKREGILEHGLGRMLKKFVSGEGTKLTKAEGHGCVYLADEGKKVSILNLDGEPIFVNGNDVLAFQETLQWDIKLMKKISAIASGGLFNIRFEGQGMVAITTHYDPLTLKVEPGRPVFTDPNATVAWSGNLTPDFKTDFQLKSFFGRGSGESFQMRFEGEGFVVVQPFEEVSVSTSNGGGISKFFGH